VPEQQDNFYNQDCSMAPQDALPQTENSQCTGFCSHISKEEINDLPLRRWEGAMRLVATHEDCTEAIQELAAEKLLGFDTETRPAFKKGQSYLPALLQLATARKVFLFQLGTLGLPEELRTILSEPTILKSGVSLAYDLRELKKIAPFQAGGFVELADEAKQLEIQNRGLRGLCAALLGFRISKSAQTSNWSKKNLTPAQQKYAATDAWVGRELYKTIKKYKSQPEQTAYLQP